MSSSTLLKSTHAAPRAAKLMHRWAIAPIAALFLLAVMHGCATGPQSVPPATSSDFPNSESFYPTAAKEWGQEGVVTVRYCVDAHGRLSGPPSVVRSSGNDDLDAGALELARAGSGHYRPAYENGNARPGCATFKAKFEMRVDPQFPTLSRRATQLTAQLRPRSELLRQQFKGLERLPDLSTVGPADQGQILRLRQFVNSTATIFQQYGTLLSEYIAKTDELGRADDVSEVERTAFSKSWQKKRLHLERVREALLDMRSFVDSVNEFADYLERAQPPLRGASGPIGPSTQQRAEIDAFIGRLRVTYSTKLQPALNEFTKSVQPQEVVPDFSQDESEKPPVSPIELESIANEVYSASSMTDAAPPRRITEPKESAESCKYPEAAGRNNEEGTTVLRLHVDATGTISAAAVARSSGYDELDAAALRCVPAVRFQPASQGGRLVASVIRYSWAWKIGWGPENNKTCQDLEPEARTLAISKEPSAQSAAILCACFEESGKPQDAQIIASSGNSRLDAGAIALAKQAATKPRPPGHAGCYAYKIKFEVKDEPGAAAPRKAH